ncbi:MAG: H-X9-DG-CTERM domain-containing protein, partial [Planctomycetota bacterium]
DDDLGGGLGFTPDFDEQHWWSFHPGITQFGMTDGSVQSISYGVDLDIFIAMLTKSGGEVTELPF